ncbi:hypothetical protein [Phytoactinopolyspora halotolerans]|uniref:DUF559 domain-containing protein n=1 Tax=Phytoactinopolyspora halotolerans TaxID=1981512 RepID=A0A6L9RZH2_9ACTN|nr:hypothetical protein [Phytoactinopolyspora halotolerans]NED98554.1 hypothetical protein [Phytoactinopolyspora halotolerans]
MVPELLLHVIRRQDGLVTRQQALAAGMSLDAWKHATRPGGRWRRVVRAVYATFTGPLGDIHRLRAAILHAGPDAAITGAWACWMHGLRYGPARSELILVSVPQRRRVGSNGFVVVTRHARADLDHDSWIDTEAAGDLGVSIAMSYQAPDGLAGTARPGVIPMLPTALAVVDTITRPRLLPAGWSATCAHDDGCPACRGGRSHAADALRNVRALMCEAVQRDACTVDGLRRALDQAGRRHTALARRVLDDLDIGCRSAPECELRDLIRTSSILPEPLWNRPLPGARGIYPDACWPEARLVIEVDSRSFHGFGDAPGRTERRRAEYARLGWRVLPVTPQRIRQDPAGLLAEIEAAYQAA